MLARREAVATALAADGSVPLCVVRAALDRPLGLLVLCAAGDTRIRGGAVTRGDWFLVACFALIGIDVAVPLWARLVSVAALVYLLSKDADVRHTSASEPQP